MDLVALQFACMINGVTSIVMTKADVLDSFEQLSVCTSYKINGRDTKQIPFQMDKVNIEPAYQQFKGWKTDSSRAKTIDDLPSEMQAYVAFINKNLSAPVKFISNGPGREQLVKI
jgi:adenylosuccinate synthase